LIRGSFVEKSTGQLTLQHYIDLGTSALYQFFWNSIKLSGLTARIGVILGTLVGYAIYRWPEGRFRETMIALSDVTTNIRRSPTGLCFVVHPGHEWRRHPIHLEILQLQALSRRQHLFLFGPGLALTFISSCP